MPIGLEVTPPEPLPVLVTETPNVGLKLAVTVTLAVTLASVHMPVPVQPPPVQPANTEPPCGPALNTSVLPAGTMVTQAPGQLMPAGLDVTVPLPAPPMTTVMVTGGGASISVAS